VEHDQQLVVLGGYEGENLGQSSLRVAPDVEQAAVRLDCWHPAVPHGRQDSVLAYSVFPGGPSNLDPLCHNSIVSHTIDKS